VNPETKTKLVARAGFKGEQLGRSPLNLHRTEIEFTDFIMIFASLKSRKVNLYF
jgi:hypothetical protein